MENDLTINYTREAFKRPLNLSLLLVAVAAAFAFRGMGMAGQLILSLAFGLELMYLGILPRMPRFQKDVKFKKLKEKNPATDEKVIFQELAPSDKKRFLVLRHLVKLIRSNFEKMPYGSQGLLDNVRDKIDELLSRYLMLLEYHNRCRLYLNTSTEEKLKLELEKESEEVGKLRSERLKQSRERRVRLLEKRLQKFHAAREKYLVSEVHMETIEDAVRYVYEQSITMTGQEEIGFQLDNLLEEVEETSKLIEDLERDILPVHSGLEDMVADDELGGIKT